MYHHIEKILYIKVEVERVTLNKALSKERGEIELPKNKQWKEIIERENKFIRFLHNGSYVDLNIKKISIETNFRIIYAGIIDYGIQRLHTYQNKQSGDICEANTCQEAADHFKVSLRHVKKIK